MSEDAKKMQSLLRWAKGRGLMICNRDAIYQLVRIVNDVALGVSAHVDENGEVFFKHVPGFDYDEMMGLKAIIHADKKFRTKPSSPEGKETEDEEDGSK